MGHVHGNQYAKMSDVRLVAYDADADRVSAYQTKFGAESASSLEELVTRVDALDVCVPTDLHLPIARQALSAGKPVLVEKPICRTVAEGRELAAAAREGNTWVMPAQVVRFFAEYETAHRAVVDGRIGRPAVIRLRRGGKCPVGADGWFRDVSRSGGVLLDLAVHEFDWLRWTFGEVRRVTSRSVRVAHPDLEAPGDYALTLCEMESGAIAHIESTWMDPGGFRITMELCGSDGQIDFDSRNFQSVRTTTEAGVQFDNALSGTDDPYYREIRAFVDAVAGRARPPVTLEDGLAALAIAEAALESARTRRPVDVVRV